MSSLFFYLSPRLPIPHPIPPPSRHKCLPQRNHRPRQEIHPYTVHELISAQDFLARFKARAPDTVARRVSIKHYSCPSDPTFLRPIHFGYTSNAAARIQQKQRKRAEIVENTGAWLISYSLTLSPLPSFLTNVIHLTSSLK